MPSTTNKLPLSILSEQIARLAEATEGEESAQARIARKAEEAFTQALAEEISKSDRFKDAVEKLWARTQADEATRKKQAEFSMGDVAGSTAPVSSARFECSCNCATETAHSIKAYEDYKKAAAQAEESATHWRCRTCNSIIDRYRNYCAHCGRWRTIPSATSVERLR